MNDHTEIRSEGERTWARWAAMWNGEIGLAHELIADGLVVHLTGPARAKGDPAALRDGRAVAAWVERIRGSYARLAYTTAAGPFVDVARGAVSSPWFADGVDHDGRPFRKAGLDILVFRDGRITEAWTINADA